MSTRTVLLIATTTGYQIRSFGDAAAALDVDLLFATDRCDHLDDPWRDRAFPVRFHEPASSARALVEALDERPARSSRSAIGRRCWPPTSTPR